MRGNVRNAKTSQVINYSIDSRRIFGYDLASSEFPSDFHTISFNPDEKVL